MLKRNQSGTLAVPKRGTTTRPRLLRKDALVTAARLALAEMATLSPATDPINVTTLAKRIGVSRPALYSNNLKADIDEYSEIQRRNALNEGKGQNTRRTLQERISVLENINIDLQEKLDAWIEKWATIEYNARMRGLNPDHLFAPMPKPERLAANFWSGTKKT